MCHHGRCPRNAKPRLLAQVLPFLEGLGLPCPPRKDVPSFLIEITTPAGQDEFASPQLRERTADVAPGVWKLAG